MSADNIDSFVDLSEFAPASISPSLSSSKSPAAHSAPTTCAAPQTIIPSAQQSFTGPSHQYDLYKQQTGLVPGALASTLAVNQASSQVSGAWDMGFTNGMSLDDSFDFNTIPPSQGSMNTSPDMDVDFTSPSPESVIFGESTVNPTSIGRQSPVLPSTGEVGRMWPGMHRKAALAKAQEQQRQQQQIIQQQQQRRQQSQTSKQHAKRPSKAALPPNPIVEQKIAQLLNSMRAKSTSSDLGDEPMIHLPRLKKDEDDMDEDERLLASEEGKKLSSKERRQLRNKVSARAFRSRRKEYITQLESEIATKVTENGDLRAQNRSLIDENKRLSDLTRMLLSSPSFSNFLEHLSADPQAAPHVTPQAAPEPEQQRRPDGLHQMPKDANPYTTTQSNQQVQMAMVPEQNVNFNIMSMDAAMSDGFNFQPQVYTATVESPEFMDASVLSGKTKSLVSDGEETKDAVVIDAPKILSPESEVADVMMAEAPAPVADPTLDEDDETLDLYRFIPAYSSTSTLPTVPAINPAEQDQYGNMFGELESEKVFARYELVGEEVQAAADELATLEFDRVCARLDATLKRLERLGFE